MNKHIVLIFSLLSLNLLHASDKVSGPKTPLRKGASVTDLLAKKAADDAKLAVAAARRTSHEDAQRAQQEAAAEKKLKVQDEIDARTLKAEMENLDRSLYPKFPDDVGTEIRTTKVRDILNKEFLAGFTFAPTSAFSKGEKVAVIRGKAPLQTLNVGVVYTTRNRICGVFVDKDGSFKIERKADIGKFH